DQPAGACGVRPSHGLLLLAGRPRPRGARAGTGRLEGRRTVGPCVGLLLADRALAAAVPHAVPEQHRLAIGGSPRSGRLILAARACAPSFGPLASARAGGSRMSTPDHSPYHFRFHLPHLHLHSVFGDDWFALKAEAFARFFGTPLFL